jgi:putative transposase
MEHEQRIRQVAVQRHLGGESVTAICRSLRRSRVWFYKWWGRYAGQSGQWWIDQLRRPRHPGRAVPKQIEVRILQLRDHLEAEGLFCGAQAVRWSLEDEGIQPLPSERTIARIIARHGRVRRRKGRYVPKGKRYPDVSGAQAGQVHQTDFVGPCYLSGGPRFYSLNTMDVATNRCAVEPVERRSDAISAIWNTWLRLGLPRYQQVDNEWVFLGSPAHPRAMGKLIRLCVLMGVEPLFIPLGEPWRNGVVEKFNDHWRQRFYGRVTLPDFPGLRAESRAFEYRHNTRYRYSKLGGKTPQQALERQAGTVRYPEQDHPPDLRQKPEDGRYHLIRFIRSDGLLDIFGERFLLPPEAVYEYVWATVDVASQRVQVRLDDKVIAGWAYRLR